MNDTPFLVGRSTPVTDGDEISKGVLIAIHNMDETTEEYAHQIYGWENKHSLGTLKGPAPKGTTPLDYGSSAVNNNIDDLNTDVKND